MVVLGYDSTLPVTMDDMIHHTKAVVRGTEHALVVGDMPFMSYQTGWQDAMRNAARLMQETGCGAVKLEGGVRSAEIVQKLVEAGIPVMGHIGLTPQSVNQLGGFKVQGKTPAAAVQLMHDAQALEQAGAFAIVLETIPAPLAELLTRAPQRADDRHRRRRGLRRPGAGLPRPARPVRRLHAEARASATPSSAMPSARPSRATPSDVRAGRVPDGEAELHAWTRPRWLSCGPTASARLGRRHALGLDS